MEEEENIKKKFPKNIKIISGEDSDFEESDESEKKYRFSRAN